MVRKATKNSTGMDHLTWVATRLKIIDKRKQMIPLVPNDHQLRLLGFWAMVDAASLPVRLLVLKYRQGGISTITEAEMFSRVFHQPNSRAMVAAHDDESSEQLFRMTKLFESELPPEERRPKDYSSKREIVWSKPHNSQFIVQTAGKMRLGRSRTLSYLHCSEVAFWNNAKQTLLSVLQSVPNEPGTAVVLESTANGVGGEFYDRWQQAVHHRREHQNDLSGFLPLFFSWLDFPEYQTPLAVGCGLGELDEDEQGLVALGATSAQINWRRMVLSTNCGGDASLFKQEYPSTPEEAFQSSGRCAIPAVITRQHRKTVERPRRARFTWDVTCDGGVRIEFGDGPQYIWDVWRTAEEQTDYTVGGDSMEGELADPADPRSDPDYCSASVLNRVELTIDAQLRRRMDPDLFGEEMVKAASYYNHAWATPEANASGIAALLVFKRRNYSRTYRRKNTDEKLQVEESGWLGWKTTTGNRDQMIDDWIAACRPDPIDGFTGRIVNRSQILAEEEETFVIDTRGKRQHRPGCHDDTLFGAMIAWQLHLHCPRTRSTGIHYKPAHRSVRYADGLDMGIQDVDEEIEVTR